MKKIFIVESFKSDEKLYLHSLEGEQFQRFVAENDHVSICTLTEESDPQDCAAIASCCLSKEDAIMAGFEAMVARDKIAPHLISKFEEVKEFAN